MAVAPASAATVPCPYGTSGTRCASTTARGERKPRCSTAIPAAAQPVRPTRATTWSGPAPDRRTGRRPSSAPNTVTEIVTSRDRVTSPPTSTTPDRSPSARIPSASSSAQASGSSLGADSPTTTANGTTTHRLDVGDVDRDRLAADLGRAGPVPPEVHPLDQHVDRGQHRSVDPEHRGVVAGTDQDLRRGGQVRGDPGDQGELTGLAESWSGGAGTDRQRLGLSCSAGLMPVRTTR